MKQKRFFFFSLLAAVIFIILAMLSESVYFSDFEYRYRTRRFNRILHEREAVMKECLESMKPLLATEDHHGSIPENDIFKTAEKNKITILEFLDNKLHYWSDNDFDVPPQYEDTLYNKPIVFLQNGWFLPRTIEAGNEKIVGLLRIRTEYGLTNEIIKTGFEKEFGVTGETGLSIDPYASGFHVSDQRGRFLFALAFPEVKQSSGFAAIPILLWLLGFLSLLLAIASGISLLVSRGYNIIAVTSALIFSMSAYGLVISTGTPGVFSRTELFSPYNFSLGKFIPTLGHLIFLGILCTFVAAVFYRFFPEVVLRRRHRKSGIILFSLALLPGTLFSILFHYLFSELIITSNINFQPYQVMDLDIFSLAGFIAFFLLSLLPVLYLLRVIRIFIHYATSVMFLSLIPSFILAAVIYHNDPSTLIPFLAFYIILIVSAWYAVRLKAGVFNLTIIFSFVFGIYCLYFITVHTEEKVTENIKIQAVAFSTENDPEAEHLLLDLWPVISTDTILQQMMRSETFNKNREDVESISSYLQSTYFRGYWSNFNFNLVLCRNDEQLRVGPANKIYPNCFEFFNDRIRRDGHRLTGTGFYFIDNQGGRPYYLGRLIYRSPENYLNGLYIELYGDINIFQPGYSSLLLDEKYHGYSGLKDYSFAKYINGEIVLRTGDFAYNKTDAEYVEKFPDYSFFNSGGFKHVLYKNGNVTVIISRPRITTGDLIISFAYLFAFLLLFSNILVLIIRRKNIRAGTSLNFRQKLQLSYIGILLFSFLLIGIVVAYLTTRQYKDKHYENIKEKLTSVYMELDNRLGMEKHIDIDWRSPEYSSLEELLIDLSNLFNTDINLYEITGNLIATSRPEIFTRNLTSTRINNMALINLKELTKSEYYQRERIGNLEYLSAYIPFFNADDKLIAYLNLPYFRMQSVLAKEISNLIVAVINFTLLLILITMGIAVVISRRLTSPLLMLGEGLEKVSIGKKTEHLSYKGNDEIGELVRQYNRMVDEIEESAQKLANSEREYAWREMAKQIAHEIKNPLTPMKLNVQQLLKSWKDKAPGFDEKLEHFSANQIEYIDNLSNIASAFSSFAKMPGNNPVEVNLIEQMKVTLELFRDNTEEVTFNVKWPVESKVYIYADKEHLNGVFSNLIKNGIQSIPPRQGRSYRCQPGGGEEQSYRIHFR